ncbi:MAG: UTP--glucose-1-phosphate uridylyltransferase GalU [Peptococcaceae bacterium]|jgi:UTP--glucose-1-phosphate uridylyltransferase|nr:UTP--glucose-1-phosphate uridylyltransferase GalU [Peptococcaceae bacterium]
MKIKKAVIPAAGLGTRFLPVTKALPKEMLPIVDKPTIQYIVEEAIESGIEDILFITSRGKWSIMDYYDRTPELEVHLEKKGDLEQLEKIKSLTYTANFHYTRQDEPLGLGHAIMCAKSFVGDEPFAVLLGDDIIKSEVPALKQLLNIADATSASVVGIQEVPKNEIHKYGVIDVLDRTENYYKVKDFVEKPQADKAPSNLAIIGRYVLNPSIFTYLEGLSAGFGGEIQLTDALKKLCHQEDVYACLFEGKRYDAGDKLGYLIATVEYALESPQLGEKFAYYLENLYLHKDKTFKSIS